MTSSHTTSYNSNQHFDKKDRIILLTIALIMLMEMIDIMVLSTSLPQIAMTLRLIPSSLKLLYLFTY